MEWPFCSVPTRRKLQGASSVGNRRKNHSQMGKMICTTATVTTHPVFIHYERFIDMTIGSFELIVARLKNIARSKTFHAGNAVQISAPHQKEAEDFIVRDVLKSIEGELKKSSNKGGRRGHYAIKLRPVLDVQVNGMWVVGERPTRYK